MQEKGLHEGNCNIKVCYKKCIFSLGKNIKTYDEFIHQVNKRFQDIKNFSFYFDEVQVDDSNFETLMKQLVQRGQKSVKFEIRDQIKECQREIKFPSKKPKRFSFNPNEFEDLMKDNHQSQDTSTKEYAKTETTKQNLQSQNLQETQTNPDNIKISTVIESQTFCIEYEVGTQYYWSCSVVNQGLKKVPNQVYIRDLTSGGLIQIGGLNVKESKQILFGPFTQKEEAKITHLFQIIYKKNKEIRYPIGPKFGFVCNSFRKNIPIKQMTNKLTERVNHLKSFSQCEKSTQYIVSKLKEFGIGEETIEEFADQDLLDMFESFNLDK